MNYASLELSEKLFEVSKWNTDLHWFETGVVTINCDECMSPTDIPKYDLGFLMRKLPTNSEVYHFYDGKYEATYHPNPGKPLAFIADTPENCTVLLCLELIRQNILEAGI